MFKSADTFLMKVFSLTIILLFICGCSKHVYDVKFDDAHIAIDPLRDCSGLNAGDLCGGGKFVGEVAGQKIVATPAGCTDSPTPTCDDSADALTLEYEGGSLITTYARYYCADLVYNGFSDWQLPTDMQAIEIYNQKALIGGIQNGIYWTIEQYYYDEFFSVDMNNGAYAYYWETDLYYVRCVRVSPN